MRYVQKINGRYRVGCHCGLGLMLNIPKGERHILLIETTCPSCKRKYTVNSSGDVYCHKCQDVFND